MEEKMKNKLAVYLIVAALFGYFSSTVSAEMRPWKIDKDHTNFYFSVDHIYSKVQGRFTDYEGTIFFDPENLAESSFSFEIEVKSVDTGINKRDRHLRSDDFFDASEYPLMSFVSKSVTLEKDNVYTVSGTLTIKNVSKEVSFPLTFEGVSDHPFEKKSEVAGFNGRLSLDRLDYGVGDGKYYKMRAVGKDVDILVTIEAMREK